MPGPAHDKLSRREREIMNAIFALGNDASAEDIRARLIDPPSYSAVRAMLVRLEAKGHVRHREEGLRYMYTATISHTAAKRAALPRLREGVLRRLARRDADDAPQAGAVDGRGARCAARRDRPRSQRKEEVMTELSLIAKVTLVLLASLAAVRVAARASASLRSLMLTSAFCVLLALPARLTRPVADGVPVPVLPAPDAAPPLQAAIAARRGAADQRAAREFRSASGYAPRGSLAHSCCSFRIVGAMLAYAVDASHSRPLDRPRRARRDLARDAGVSRSIETLLARRRARTAHDGDRAAGDRAADRRTDLGRERPPSSARPRDRAHSPQRLDRPRAGARRLRDLLVPSARVDGVASPSSRLGARVRRRRAAAGGRDRVCGAVAAAGASPQHELRGRAVHGEPNRSLDEDRGGHRCFAASRSTRTNVDDRDMRPCVMLVVAGDRARAGRARVRDAQSATSSIRSVARSRT